jgi:hypothetical protein
MTLEQLKASIEAEALRRQAARDGFTLEAVESFLGKGIVAPPELRSDAPPPPAMPAPYGYYASLSGRELITTAYTLLLGRSPDPNGMAHYMALLARGEDKAIVVGSLAYSAEGRRRGARVPGLFPRFAVMMAQRIPLLGGLLAWALALLTLPSQLRQARAFEHYARIRMDTIGAFVAQSGSQIALRLESLRDVLEKG